MNAKIYHSPKNEQPMDELYVVLSQDADGHEGIVSAYTQVGAMPMVFGHERMLEPIREQLRIMSKDTGRTLVIAKYKKTEILEKISTAN
jgi:hypothetical protein